MPIAFIRLSPESFERLFRGSKSMTARCGEPINWIKFALEIQFYEFKFTVLQVFLASSRSR